MRLMPIKNRLLPINRKSCSRKRRKTGKPFRKKEKWRRWKRIYCSRTDYRIQVQDGFRSGEKVAFVTLEDYSGSYSFRLGDRDYMRLKEKLEVQRFVIFKIKFAQVKDGRVFVNVNDVIELQEAFERFAKSISLVMDVMDVRPEDLDFSERFWTGIKEIRN
jgi:DNA polymerase III alpha subunit